MKQTNLLSCRLCTTRTGVFKSFGFLFTALAVLFVLGTQNVTAQTAIGELQTENTVKLIQSEIDFLAAEMKAPPASGSIELNGPLAAYYQKAMTQLSTVEGFNSALLNLELLNSPLVKSSTTTFSAATTDFVAPKSDEYQQLQNLVNDLNLLDNDDSDLIAIFNYLRTLKNQ